MPLADDLKRWVDAELIDPGTATEIEAYEAMRNGRGRIGRGMEAIAYLGAALVLVALGLLATEFWDRIEPWGQLLLGALVTTVLLASGWFLGRSEDSTVARAQTFAWLLAEAGAALVAYVVFAEFSSVTDESVFLLVSIVTFGAGLVLWLLRKSVLQVIGLWAASMIAVVAVLSRIDETPDWAFGATFAGIGLIWLFLTWVGILKPVRTSYGLGSIAALLVAFPEGIEMPWPLLGLAVGLGLMGASVILNQSVLLGFGVAGLFVYIPMSVFELFGETLGVPVALLITGLVLLGVVVVTVRLRRETVP